MLQEIKQTQDIGVKYGRYAIFASYNKEGKISDEVLFYLKELNKIVDGVVFIADNSANEEEIKKLDNLTIHYEFERHNEYDFGSYKRGFFWLKNNGFLESANELIFANDSCWGPLRPFDEFIKKWNNESSPDFYGVTTNYWGFTAPPPNDLYTMTPDTRHVQSYFFLVTKKVFEKQDFIDFMKEIKHFEDKHDIIYYYEMGLSRLIGKMGFPLKSLFDYKGVDDCSLKGRKTRKTIKEGFFIKKNISKFQDVALINSYIANSFFPYFIQEGKLEEKLPFIPSWLYLLKYKLIAFLHIFFNIRKEGKNKILIRFFGLRFKKTLD